MASRSLRILNVDDEQNIRTITKLALTSKGFIVENCGSGEEALKKVRTFSPDLILLDVMMPNMDGPTLMKALRKIPKTSSTPIIFLTAMAQKREIAQYKSLGAVDVIMKPFNPLTLSTLVKKILERPHG
jgi:two-component system OmpR family response regulator